MYSQPCSILLTLDLSSLISFRNRESIGYQPHQVWVILLAMPNFDVYCKPSPMFWLFSVSMSTCPKLFKLCFSTAIVTQMHPLCVRIHPGKCRSACWRMGALTRIIIDYTTVIAGGLKHCSMDCEPKEILTWGSNSRCLGEIRQFGSPFLLVWSILAVNSVNICKTKLSNINILGKCTIQIPPLNCLFKMAKAISSTFELANSVTTDFLTSFICAMSTLASKWYATELMPYSEGWRRSWSVTWHVMPWQLVFSILQCTFYRHDGECLHLFQTMGPCKPMKIEANWASNIICKVRLLKSQIMTPSSVQDILTSSNEVYIDTESEIMEGIWWLHNPTCEPAISYIMVK